MGSRAGMTGALAGFAAGFAAELVEQGYRPGSAAAQLELMADVSVRLAARGLGAGDLTDAVVGQLMSERCASGRSRLLSRRALAPLLEYLRGLGVAPLPQSTASVTASEVLIERYSLYLLERRGLASSTVRNYVGVAREFLA